MAIHEDVIGSYEGSGRSPTWGILCKMLFMTIFDTLVIILVKNDDQQGRTLTIVGMIDKEVLQRGCVS